MGMFDSFLIEIEGKPVELQSKRFDCILENYSVGDVVGGAAGGVRVYLDRVGLDAQGKWCWRDEESVTRWTVFLILAHGVFVDYEAVEGEVDNDSALRRIRELREKWEDSARLLGRLVAALSEKQARIDRLESRISHARNAIREARRIRAGEERPYFHFSRAYSDRLERGDDALDVLEWVLGEEWPGLFRRGGPDERNPLEDCLL
jgi:hypothetical protein